MAFTVSQGGSAAIRRRLDAIRRAGRVTEVAAEADRRFTRTMRRRGIPVRTGRLKASLTQTGHKDHVLRVGKDRITIGTRVPYAQWQRKRIRRLNRAEKVFIFLDPIREMFRRIIAGRGR